MAEINEIVSNKAIEDAIKLLNTLGLMGDKMENVIKNTDAMKKKLDEIGASSSDATVKTTAYQKILSEVDKEQVKINATAKEMQNQQNQLITVTAKLNTVQDANNKELIKKRIALQEETKAIKDSLKVNEAEEGSLTRMRQKLSELTKAYDNSGKRTKEAAKEIANLSREIQNAENETNRFQRGVGDYKSGVADLVGGLKSGEIGMAGFKNGIIGIGKAALTFLLSPVGMIVAAVAGIAMVGKALITNATEFQKASSSLSAITGATGKDLDFMKKKAIEYSKTSVSSATDIVAAFEKIGSAMPALLTQKELLTEVTKNAITLSEASGGGLSIEDAAKAAASAINQFNIPLTESAMVVNTLAAGSLAGSAEVGDLAESFKNAGTVAASAGMNLQQTVAALEVLGEKSLYGAEAGTKLRGAILKLQDAGMGYASGVFNYRDALVEANKAMADQETAQKKDALAAKLFGAENITAGKILIDNIDKYDDLTEAITNNKTAAEDMAKTQKDNLSSSYKMLSNAWKGLMLGMEDGSGIIMKTWKGIIDGIAWTLNAISSIGDKFRSKEEKAAKQQAIEANAAEERKRAELLKTAEQMNLQIDEKMSNAEIEKKINEEMAKSQAQIQDKTAKETKAAQDKALEEKKKIAEEQAKQLADQAQHDYEMQLLLIQATSKSKEEADQRTFEFKKESLLKTLSLYEQELKAFKGSELEKLAIQEKINKARFDLEKSGMEERQKLNENAPVKLIDSSKKTADQLKKIDQKQTDDLISSTIRANNTRQIQTETYIKDTEEKEKKRKDIIEAGTNAAIEIQGTLFDFMDKKYSADLQKLEQKNAAGLLSEKEYATQKAEIEIKQAKMAKLRGIFETTINTASAIVGMLKDPGGIVGTIMAVAAGVTGALQIASIVSQPLPTMPTFAKGTKNAPALGLAGEAGTELGITSTGEAIIFSEPTIFSGNKFKGMRIYSNPEFEAMKQQVNNPFHAGSSSYSDKNVLKGLKAIEKGINNIKIPLSGTIGYRQGNHTERFINNYRV